MADLETPAPFKVAKINPQMVSRGKRGRCLGPYSQGRSGCHQGGETNHTPTGQRRFTWLVVAGQATFTRGDGSCATQQNDLQTPGTPYWFESSKEAPIIRTARAQNTPTSASITARQTAQFIPDAFFTLGFSR
jgi:hypothetical protein